MLLHVSITPKSHPPITWNLASEFSASSLLWKILMKYILWYTNFENLRNLLVHLRKSLIYLKFRHNHKNHQYNKIFINIVYIFLWDSLIVFIPMCICTGSLKLLYLLAGLSLSAWYCFPLLVGEGLCESLGFNIISEKSFNKYWPWILF